jgi:hypothetical protein
MKYEEPMAYLERTGEKWPENNAVYFTPKDGRGHWSINSYAYAQWIDAETIICATEAGIPPDGTTRHDLLLMEMRGED